MLTKDQKVKKLEIQLASYKIQDLISRTFQQNIKNHTPNYGDTVKEIESTLKELRGNLQDNLTEYSSSLFTSQEISNIETTLSGSALYGS